MTSAWVLLISSVLHIAFQKQCFLILEQVPGVPDTILARYISYCAMLHFLYDQELVPARYRRKMGRLTGFLMELVLGVAFMEVLAQWLWLRIEHIVHRVLMLALRRYGCLTIDLYQHLEATFMRGIMTLLAGLLWLNAFAATDPTEPEPAQVKLKPMPKVAPSPSLAKASFNLRRRLLASFNLRRRLLAIRKEQLARRTRNQKREQKQKQPASEEDGPEHLTKVASTSDC